MLQSCMSINVSNTTDNPGFHLKDEFSLPFLLVLTVTLLLSCLVILSFLLSQCHKSSHTMLYFNVSLLDASMALVGVLVVGIPRSLWGKDWVLSWMLMLILLRSVWSLSVLILTTIRYRMIQRKPPLSPRTTVLLITAVWIYSTTTTVLWYLLTPEGLWKHLQGTIGGIILQNFLVLSSSLPIPAVLILLVLTSVRARQELSRITAEDETAISPSASRQMEHDLNLITAFGFVFLLGYVTLFVANMNSLINLGGAIDVVPYWQRDKNVCEILGTVDTVCNVFANFANSVILVRSRHVQHALREMYRSSSRVVRRGREDGDRLVVSGG